MANELDEAMGYKCFDYFTYQGEDYLLNTMVRLTDKGKNQLRTEYRETQIVGHCMTDNGKHYYRYVRAWVYNNGTKRAVTDISCTSPDEMIEAIVVPARKIDNANNKQEYYKDYEVGGVLAGWVLYIAIMIFLLIFKEFYIGWFFVSIYFFTWRKKVLKKPKIENYGNMFSYYKKD